MNILYINLKYKLNLWILILIINEIIIVINVYGHMLIMIKHQFACD
jgi:hypothetical protein